MAYKHGISVTESPTNFLTPIKGTAGLAVFRLSWRAVNHSWFYLLPTGSISTDQICQEAKVLYCVFSLRRQ